MQKYFDSQKTASQFKRLVLSAGLNDIQKAAFVGKIAEKYMEKQASEEDTLHSFKVTNYELMILWRNFQFYNLQKITK